ncbi:hypothetical protein NECAME_11309, partial [Necator americanus]
SFRGGFYYEFLLDGVIECVKVMVELFALETKFSGRKHNLLTLKSYETDFNRGSNDMRKENPERISCGGEIIYGDNGDGSEKKHSVTQ